MINTTDYMYGEFKKAKEIIARYKEKKPILTLEREVLETLTSTLTTQSRTYDFIPENFIEDMKTIIADLKNTNH